MSKEPHTPVDPGPKGPQLDEMLDSLMGWNRNFIRTLKDSFLHPEWVAGAVLHQDQQAYANPIRLLVFLFGLYMTLTVFIVGTDAQSVEAVAPAGPEILNAWLTEQGTSLDEVNAVWGFWLQVFIWPILVLSSLPYALLFKAYAPRRTLYGAVLVYLTTINAMTAAQIVLTIVLLPFVGKEMSLVFGLLIVTLYYFYVTGRVLYAHYASTLWGTLLKLFSFVLLTPVTIVITVLLQLLAFDQVMEHRFDLNVSDIVQLRGDTAP
ncbi:DUF3667 domain-containing protein [Oceanicaulis sp. MMSF_3324]|uniref:DUF3667 domain-containing protein n=1 Tax=Oceanicaulis sp. MMSF_3324 TaxID=3046702 RepID=UPI00273DEA15|nr:DUF3667 domain-containing protein [Oceanicaulis sp. MMSF_3324]